MDINALEENIPGQSLVQNLEVSFSGRGILRREFWEASFRFYHRTLLLDIRLPLLVACGQARKPEEYHSTNCGRNTTSGQQYPEATGELLPHGHPRIRPT